MLTILSLTYVPVLCSSTATSPRSRLSSSISSIRFAGHHRISLSLASSALTSHLHPTSMPPPPSGNCSTSPQPRPQWEDHFVWPWMGVLTHVLISEASAPKLSRFNPAEILCLWDENDKGRGAAIVKFNKDWSGFKDAMAFGTVLTRKNHLTGVEYRDDPTIFASELMNEPRCITDPSGDTLQVDVKFTEDLLKTHWLTQKPSSQTFSCPRANNPFWGGMLMVQIWSTWRTPRLHRSPTTQMFEEFTP